MVLRGDFFLGTPRRTRGRISWRACPRFYPDLNDDFVGLLPEADRAKPLDAYWRRILDADPAVHGPFARAWHDTERILSEHVRGGCVWITLH